MSGYVFLLLTIVVTLLLAAYGFYNFNLRKDKQYFEAVTSKTHSALENLSFKYWLECTQPK